MSKTVSDALELHTNITMQLCFIQTNIEVLLILIKWYKWKYFIITTRTRYNNIPRYFGTRNTCIDFEL